MKKIICILLCCAMCMPLALCLTSCSKDPEEIGEPIYIEEDAYSMAAEGEDVSGKILSSALSLIGKGVSSGISSGVSSVATSVANWAVKGILKSLGFDYSNDNDFNKTVLNKLDGLESSMKDISKQLDALSDSVADSSRKESYNAFLKKYNELNGMIYANYSNLIDLEDAIVAKKQNIKVEEGIRKISNSINSSSTRSELDKELANFAYLIVGNSNSIEALSNDNIFETVYMFSSKESVYLENRRASFESAIVEPFNTYKAGVELATLNYTVLLEDYGIEKMWYAPAVDDGKLSKTSITIIAYKYEGTVYINMTNTAYEQYHALYADIFKDASLKDAEVQAMSLADTDAGAISKNLTAMLSKYNQIVALYDQFMESKKLNTVDINSSNRTWAGNNSFKQTAAATVTTVWAKDILSVSEISGSGDISVNYGAFGNISKADFIAFATGIDNVLDNDNLTFKQFFINEGFNFPINNETSYLILGAEKGFKDYSDYYNNGYKYQNCVAICCVDLNTKIADFVKNNNFVKVYYTMYCTKKRQNSNTCVPNVEEFWTLAEGTGDGKTNYVRSITYITQNLSTWSAYRSTYNYNKPIKYYSISGLSSSPKTNTVHRNSLSF